MPTIADILTQGANDKVEIKSQVNLNGQANKVFKTFLDSFGVHEQAFKLEERNIGGSIGIYGNPAFGIYGTATYGNTPVTGFVLGNVLAGILGTNELGETGAAFKTVRVIPPNRNFTERFLGTVFVDDSSTATISGGTATFTTGEELLSEIIYKNEETLSSATLTSVHTGTDPSFYMKATSESLLPVGHFKMNDNLATTNVVDSIGSNNGTLGGGSNTDDLSTTGKINESLNFTGVDSISLSASLKPIVNRTYTLWFYPTISTESTILGGDNGGDGNILRIQAGTIGLHNAGTWTIKLNDIEATGVTGDSGLSVNLNEWNFLVAYQTSTTTWDNFYIGKAENNRFFEGKIDDVRIYDSVPTQSDIDLINNSDNGTEEDDVYFEEVTNSVQHTFTNQGDDLKYKVVASDSAEITKLEVTF